MFRSEVSMAETGARSLQTAALLKINAHLLANAALTPEAFSLTAEEQAAIAAELERHRAECLLQAERITRRLKKLSEKVERLRRRALVVAAMKQTTPDTETQTHKWLDLQLALLDESAAPQQLARIERLKLQLETLQAEAERAATWLDRR